MASEEAKPLVEEGKKDTGLSALVEKKKLGRTIVVAVDHSEFAEWTFNFAMSIVHKETDRVIIVSVADCLNSVVYTQAFTTTHYLDEAQKNLERRTKFRLVPYGRRCKKMGILDYTMVMTTSDDAGSSIVALCKKVHADVVIVGRRGMNGVKRFFVGSTSRHVVEHAPCHVIVVKGKEESHDDEVKTEVDPHTFHAVPHDTEVPDEAEKKEE